MNREQTLTALNNIAERIAKEHNLTIVSSGEITLGVWDNIKDLPPLSKIIAEKLEATGEHFGEIHFTDVPYEEYDLRKHFKVTRSYHFSNPKIEVGTQWGSGYANATFCGDENDENYEMSSSQVFKEGGIPLFNQIMEYWHEEKKKIEG